MKTLNITFEDSEYKELIKKKQEVTKKLKKGVFSWQNLSYISINITMEDLKILKDNHYNIRVLPIWNMGNFTPSYTIIHRKKIKPS